MPSAPARLTPEERALAARCRAGDEDAWLAQIFLKDPRASSNSVAGRLMVDGELQEGEVVDLTADVLVGVDLLLRPRRGARRRRVRLGHPPHRGATYGYVMMQDTPVFTDARPFGDALDGGVAYTFAVGASEDAPMTPATGCYLTAVVDFSAVGGA